MYPTGLSNNSHSNLLPPLLPHSGEADLEYWGGGGGGGEGDGGGGRKNFHFVGNVQLHQSTTRNKLSYNSK